MLARPVLTSEHPGRCLGSKREAGSSFSSFSFCPVNVSPPLPPRPTKIHGITAGRQFSSNREAVWGGRRCVCVLKAKRSIVVSHKGVYNLLLLQLSVPQESGSTTEYVRRCWTERRNEQKATILDKNQRFLQCHHSWDTQFHATPFLKVIPIALQVWFWGTPC